MEKLNDFTRKKSCICIASIAILKCILAEESQLSKEHAIPLLSEADYLLVNFLIMSDLFIHTSSILTYRMRPSTCNAFYIKQSRQEVQKNAFSGLGAKAWNGIPVSVRNLRKQKFKQKLHSILMNIFKKFDSYLDFQQNVQRT